MDAARVFIVFIAATLLITGCGAPATPPAQNPTPADQSRQPNIVWITLDACRAQNLHCYGYERATSPAIDALAARGVLFDRHYTQGVWTVLSVPSYMSGKYFPVSCVALGNADAPREVPPGEYLLPEVLRQAGYHTYCVTGQPYIAPHTRLYRAFDNADLIKPAAAQDKISIQQLNSALFPKLAQMKRPFFVHMHAMDTHFPHSPEPPYDQWAKPGYASPGIVNGIPTQLAGFQFSEADRRHLRDLYDTSVRRADAGVADIVAELERLGVLQNTVLVISADHGDALAEDGTTWGHLEPPDEVLRVPLIICGPGVPGGVRVDKFTENVDIMPTLVALAGVTSDAVTDGASLVPTWTAGGAWDKPCVFTRSAARGYEKPPTYILRDDRFKYERNDTNGQERLWACPDALASRKDVAAANPEALAQFRKLCDERYAPRWNAYDNLPKKYVDFDVPVALDQILADPAADIARDTSGAPLAGQCGDNRWTLTSKGICAASWRQTPPPLALRFHVQPGVYTVYAMLLGAVDVQGHRASSVRIAAEGGGYKTYEWSPPGNDATTSLFIDIGTYTIDDGAFEATLATANPEYWAAVSYFRLIRQDAPAESEADRQQREEQLRALGYVN